MSDEEKKDAPEASQPEPNKDEAVKQEDTASPPAADKVSLTDEEQEAKVKAAAEARAARAAARANNAQAGADGDAPAADKAAASDEEKEAKAKAAEEARAARANARAKKAEDEENAAPKEPSPLQPRLDRFVAIIKQALGEESVEEAFINEKDGHLPYVIIKNDKWAAAAELLKQHSEFNFNYLRNVSGVDQETHMEVVYHLLCMETKHELCVKVKTDRDGGSVPSVTSVWPTANWNEREIYDLLGIEFPGHPDLRRIMMSDDWVGHPLRKDYEPLDPEV
jgi:NADH-quinone oxidoreductase subunit C